MLNRKVSGRARIAAEVGEKIIHRASAVTRKAAHFLSHPVFFIMLSAPMFHVSFPICRIVCGLMLEKHTKNAGK